MLEPSRSLIEIGKKAKIRAHTSKPRTRQGKLGNRLKKRLLTLPMMPVEWQKKSRRSRRKQAGL